MIRFSCQHCDHPYLLPDALAHVPLLCKGCGQRLAVPAPGTDNPPPPADEPEDDPGGEPEDDPVDDPAAWVDFAGKDDVRMVADPDVDFDPDADGDPETEADAPES